MIGGSDPDIDIASLSQFKARPERERLVRIAGWMEWRLLDQEPVPEE